MTDSSPIEGLVIAATTIRIPAPGHRPDAVLALVEVAGSRCLVTLPIDPTQLPLPGDLVRLG
jgi:uncharacterized OB-fold protein